MTTILDLIDFYYECENHPFCRCKHYKICYVMCFIYSFNGPTRLDFPIPTTIIYAEGEI